MECMPGSKTILRTGREEGEDPGNGEGCGRWSTLRQGVRSGEILNIPILLVVNHSKAALLGVIQYQLQVTTCNQFTEAGPWRLPVSITSA
jgi:hypothetical protein